MSRTHYNTSARLYIAPVAPVWWSVIALLTHFHTPTPCQISHPPPQPYPGLLTSNKSLKMACCALILETPSSYCSKNLVLHPLSRIWAARFCLHVALGYFPGRCTNSVTRARSQTDPAASCPTSCPSRYSHVVSDKCTRMTRRFQRFAEHVYSWCSLSHTTHLLSGSLQITSIFTDHVALKSVWNHVFKLKRSLVVFHSQ